MATLGSKPQLITLALDCLHQQGIKPEEVVVFYTWRERPETAQALTRLGEDAAQTSTAPRYRFLELSGPDGVLRDVTSPHVPLTTHRRAAFALGLPQGGRTLGTGTRQSDPTRAAAQSVLYVKSCGTSLEKRVSELGKTRKTKWVLTCTI